MDLATLSSIKSFTELGDDDDDREEEKSDDGWKLGFYKVNDGVQLKNLQFELMLWVKEQLDFGWHYREVMKKCAAANASR
ncbi:hypothetical protein C5167_038751 [Papaver somniferum]|uniref:Uncharacterized protein n=1 Tax=Papaver somniferum TaxID=3469 RepID=A0A4Y7IDS2_PAPSO|nr:hypothetical protein C5167_038751 [Papaver somniferum]